MEYKNRLTDFAPALTEAEVAAEVARIKELSARNCRKEVYAFALSAVDLTTLTCNDSVESVSAFAKRAVDFYVKYPDLANVASICVYPSFVETVGLAVDGSPMRITSVAAGFPASQTFLEVKMLEVAMAIENGADEVDIVLALNSFLAGNHEAAAEEIRQVRKSIDEVAERQGRKVHLKVILETGLLRTPERIAQASFLAMEAGADFIKTSTGKVDVNATPAAAYVMCECIAKYHAVTGKKIGFKPAGGISSAADALCYYSIVASILGKEWLNKELFRFGVSRVANSILSAVEQKTVSYY